MRCRLISTRFVVHAKTWAFQLTILLINHQIGNILLLQLQEITEIRIAFRTFGRFNNEAAERLARH
ncbi:hypothetical protein D3C72_630470 [compost metagenome]